MTRALRWMLAFTVLALLLLFGLTALPLRQDLRPWLRVALVIALVGCSVFWWSSVRALSKLVEWMRRFRVGSFTDHRVPPQKGLFAPLAREVSYLATHLLAARSAAEEEARLRNLMESRWTAARLKEHVRSALKGQPLFVVSNRNNFLETVDRTLECRIDREQLAVNRADHITWVKPFPISIAGPDASEASAVDRAPGSAKTAALSALDLHVQWLGVGVDRLDYTSQFTGASRELRDALIVNPYDIDQVAEAIHYAVMMDGEEQRARMSRMRQALQEHNIYRWAATLVTELARVPAATE